MSTPMDPVTGTARSAATDPGTAAGLPTLPWSAVTFVHLYYDGPLNGLCQHAGRPHYFAADAAAPLGDRLLVYPLTDAECALEVELKALFEQTVGTYWSRDLPPEQRVIRNCQAGPTYEELAAARFPDHDATADRIRYTSRAPVAVIE